MFEKFLLFFLQLLKFCSSFAKNKDDMNLKKLTQSRKKGIVLDSVDRTSALYQEMLDRLHSAELIAEQNGGIYPDSAEDDAKMLEWIYQHNEIASPTCIVI